MEYWKKMDLSSQNNNFDCGKWNLTSEEAYTKDIHRWWVQGLASFIIGTIGILVSIVAITILSDRRLNRILFHRLVMCMASFDIIYLTCSLFDSYRFNFIKSNYYCPVNEIGLVAVFLVHPLRKIMTCCSVYMTLVVTFERFSAATNPTAHRKRSIYSSLNRRTIKYVSVAAVVAILYELPLFVAYQIKEKELEGTLRDCISPWLTEHPFYTIAQNDVNDLLVTFVIPFTLIAFFCFHICRAIKDGLKSDDQVIVRKMRSTSTKSYFASDKEIGPLDVWKNNNDLNQSIILIWIVISFLICNVPRVALNIEEIITRADRNQIMSRANELGMKCVGVKFWSFIAADWSYFLQNLAPTLKFCIYFYLSNTFKEVLKSKLLAMMTCGKYVTHNVGEVAI